MHVALKKIKHSEFASQETVCFTAEIHIDGKKAGTVSNDGRGGMNMIHPRSTLDALEAYAATLPERDLSGVGVAMKVKMDADQLISDLVADHLIRRDMKKALSSHVVFTRIEDGTPKIYQTKRMSAADVAKHLAAPNLAQHFKAAAILNLLPEDEAFALWRNDQPST